MTAGEGLSSLLIPAGMVAQIFQKGGARTLRTLARAYTDSLLRQGQGKVAAESLRQMKEVRAVVAAYARAVCE